jgi:hypothetical protein
MKIHTDVTSYQTLPAVQGSTPGRRFSRELQPDRASHFPGYMCRFADQGQIPEICAIITRSEYYVAIRQNSSGEPETKIPWEACSLQQCMGIIVPFLIDITVDPWNSIPWGIRWC